jgi:hypothetical protein
LFQARHLAARFFLSAIAFSPMVMLIARDIEAL